MTFRSVKDIKRAQKESLLRRKIAEWMHEASQDDDRLQKFVLNRVKLSPDKGTCTIYLYSAAGKEYFDKMHDHLQLYKGALRRALAQAIPSRYTVNLIFKFDEAFEKQQEIEALIDTLKEEDKL